MQNRAEGEIELGADGQNLSQGSKKCGRHTDGQNIPQWAGK